MFFLVGVVLPTALGAVQAVRQAATSYNDLESAMAQLIRSAKSGKDWTDAELLAYNISIVPTSPADFFRYSADSSLDNLDSAILTAPNSEDPNLEEGTADYLGYLDFATYGTQESVIADFAAATLRLLGFNERYMTVAN